MSGLPQTRKFDEASSSSSSSSQPPNQQQLQKDEALEVIRGKYLNALMQMQGQQPNNNENDNAPNNQVQVKVEAGNSSSKNCKKKARTEATIPEADITPEVNKLFFCPLTMGVMNNPMKAADGHTYECWAIKEWIKNCKISFLDNRTSLTIGGLIDNTSLRDQIREFVGRLDCPDDTKREFEAAKQLSGVEEKLEADIMIKAKALFKEGKFLEAAELGHPRAMSKMSKNFMLGKGGFAVNKNKAFEFATKSADAGDNDGQFQLALCYKEGVGVPKNWAVALTWYERCKDKNPKAANNNMGIIYVKGGHGVVKNLTKAAECYRKAADLGVKESQFSLAGMYFKGKGVE